MVVNMKAALSFGLPAAIARVEDCADFGTTVSPYIWQLYSLPSALWALRSLDDFATLYLRINPLVMAFAFSLAISPIFLLVSEVNKNYSQVDRMWSILPSLYNTHYAIWAHMAGLPVRRMDLVLLVSWVWSARLTFNYWRKGGYSIGSEDYRWEIVAKKVGPLGMFLFNVSFISFGQS
ncbi:hypothetical protein LTS18_013457, partial [Coniosporium uncinatum]